MSLLTGCAVAGVPTSLRVHVARPLPERPVINPEGLSPDAIDWLRSLVEAQESNCATLETFNGKSPKQAARDCEVP